MTLVSGPPREPQEREAAPEVVPNPGSCSWTREGKAGGGGGKMGGECQQGLVGGGRRGVAMVTGGGGARSAVNHLGAAWEGQDWGGDHAKSRVGYRDILDWRDSVSMATIAWRKGRI